MTYYIQYKYPGQPLETIDECETLREANRMLAEYRMAFPPGSVLYVSSRSCKQWREGQ